ncbi:hypothetical protein Tco_0494322 [Tanacetum coccineum]
MNSCSRMYYYESYYREGKCYEDRNRRCAKSSTSQYRVGSSDYRHAARKHVKSLLQVDLLNVIAANGVYEIGGERSIIDIELEELSGGVEGGGEELSLVQTVH